MCTLEYTRVYDDECQEQDQPDPPAAPAPAASVPAALAPAAYVLAAPAPVAPAPATCTDSNI